MYKILGITAIIGTLVFISKNKVDEYSAVFKKLKVKFLGVSDIGFNNGTINLNVHLRLINNSNVNLDVVTGNAVIIRRILFYNNVGEFLGEASPNVSAIQIPANSSLEVKNIPAVVPITKIEDLFGTAMSIFQDTNNLKVKIELEVFGKTTIIDA